jgi:hypothetical protein
MEPIASLLTDGLAEALSGHRCVSAWLGYGEPLFMGFASELLPDRGFDRQPEPPYELQTNFADWHLTAPDGGPAAINDALGWFVSGWQLPAPGHLTIQFAGGARLRVVPWSENREAWSLVLPGRRFVEVCCDGRVRAGRTDEPIRPWPKVPA